MCQQTGGVLGKCPLSGSPTHSQGLYSDGLPSDSGCCVRLRQIEVFHAVYSAGTMTGAAQLLQVSQPSVSKVIAHAEQQLGYPLFERLRGKLVPTPEAHRLFDYVSAVYKSVDELRHVSENLRATNAGRIRLAVTPALGADLVPTAIASYHDQHPETVFDVQTLHHDEIVDAIGQLRIDIGLAFAPVRSPSIDTRRVGKGQFVVLGPKALDAGDGDTLQLQDLAGVPFIALSPGGPLGQLLQRHVHASGVSLTPVVYSETYHFAKALVEKGLGVTIIDEVTAKTPGAAEKSVRLWQLTPTLEFDIGVMYSSNAPLSLVARRFVDHLDATVKSYLA